MISTSDIILENTYQTDDENSWKVRNDKIISLQKELEKLKEEQRQITSTNIQKTIKKFANDFYKQVIDNNGILIHSPYFSGCPEFVNMDNLNHYSYPLICNDTLKYNNMFEKDNNLDMKILSIKPPEGELEEKLYPYVIEYLKDILPINVKKDFKCFRKLNENNIFNPIIEKKLHIPFVNLELLKDIIYFTYEQPFKTYAEISKNDIMKHITHAKLSIFYTNDFLQ